jgi:hypothetical protein
MEWGGGLARVQGSAGIRGYTEGVYTLISRGRDDVDELMSTRVTINSVPAAATKVRSQSTYQRTVSPRQGESH